MIDFYLLITRKPLSEIRFVWGILTVCFIIVISNKLNVWKMRFDKKDLVARSWRVYCIFHYCANFWCLSLELQIEELAKLIQKVWIFTLFHILIVFFFFCILFWFLVVI